MNLEFGKFTVPHFFAKILYVLLTLTVSSFVVYSLWNMVLPELFNFKPITWLQAAILLVLCKVLFLNNIVVNNTEECECDCEEVEAGKP